MSWRSARPVFARALDAVGYRSRNRTQLIVHDPCPAADHDELRNALGRSEHFATGFALGWQPAVSRLHGPARSLRELVFEPAPAATGAGHCHEDSRGNRHEHQQR
jgi:hypothetical protein